MNHLPRLKSEEGYLPVQHTPGIAEHAGLSQPLVGGAGVPEYLGMVMKRKGRVLSAGFIGLLLGIMLTIPQTPIYQARTSLEVQDINQEFMNFKQLSPIADSTAINALSDLQTQIKILQSDALSDLTIARLKANKPPCPVPQPGGKSVWRSVIGKFRRPRPETKSELLIGAAKSRKVRAAGQTRIIELTVDSHDPQTACAFANMLASEFIEQTVESRWQMTNRTSEYLSHQLEDMRSKLERSDGALQSYARQNNLLYTGDKQSVSEEKLSQFQLQLSAAQADQVAKKSRYETAKRTEPDTLPEVLNDSVYRDLQMKLADLLRQRAELGSMFKPEYSKYKRVEAQISEVEAALERSRNGIVRLLQNEYEEAKYHEQLLTAAYAAQSRIVHEDSEKAVQYNILKRDVDTNRQVYEAMLQSVKEAAIASAAKPSNIHIVDSAKLPVTPYSPILPLNAAIGMIAGCMVGVAGITMRNRADVILQQPGEAASLLGVPELGIIPSAGVKKKRPILNGRMDLSLTPANSMSALLGNSFRGVLASIWAPGHVTRRNRVLVIASAGSGEGKSTTCCNLARAMGQIGLKVLVIDADLHQPRLHQLFGLENKSGLSDLLAQPVLDERAASQVVRDSGILGLQVVTSGSGKMSTNLFFSELPNQLIGYYRTQYDVILIDTPPVLLVPDGRLLAHTADAVVLVVRAGMTSRSSAVEAYQQLRAHDSRVLGVILNDFKAKSSTMPYYGHPDSARYVSVPATAFRV